jgi:putative chitinase
MILKINSQGEEVKKLQEKLGVNVDGDFGRKTAQALKAYQRSQGLKADGIFGDKTRALLFADDSPMDVNSSVSLRDSKFTELVGHLPDKVIAQVPECAEKFEIDSPLRLAHFLAQCSYESADFRLTQENLNYSVSGLKRVFRKYFRGNLAAKYARHPEKIASRVYGGRMGNGNEASKEGYKYRGRGYIQLTGKSNYRSFNEVVNEDVIADPALVAGQYALLSAAWYWNSRFLNRIADTGADKAAVRRVTKKVNGGYNGLTDRIQQFRKYYSLLT